MPFCNQAPGGPFAPMVHHDGAGGIVVYHFPMSADPRARDIPIETGGTEYFWWKWPLQWTHDFRRSESIKLSKVRFQYESQTVAAAEGFPVKSLVKLSPSVSEWLIPIRSARNLVAEASLSAAPELWSPVGFINEFALVLRRFVAWGMISECDSNLKGSYTTKRKQI